MKFGYAVAAAIMLVASNANAAVINFGFGLSPGQAAYAGYGSFSISDTYKADHIYEILSLTGTILDVATGETFQIADHPSSNVFGFVIGENAQSVTNFFQYLDVIGSSRTLFGLFRYEDGEAQLFRYHAYSSSITIKFAGDFPQPVPPAVPEPSTWAMLVAGFGAVGLALRRRTRTRLRFA